MLPAEPWRQTPCERHGGCSQPALSRRNTHSLASWLWENKAKLAQLQSGLLVLYFVPCTITVVFTASLPQPGLNPLRVPAKLPFHFHAMADARSPSVACHTFPDANLRVRDSSRKCLWSRREAAAPCWLPLWLQQAPRGALPACAGTDRKGRGPAATSTSGLIALLCPCAACWPLSCNSYGVDFLKIQALLSKQTTSRRVTTWQEINSVSSRS